MSMNIDYAHSFSGPTAAPLWNAGADGPATKNSWIKLRRDGNMNATKSRGTMVLHGVDISAYQPDWKPNDDDSFVFIKSTEGSTWVSFSRDLQADRARVAGLQVGWYHFLWPDNPLRQAAWFVANTDIQPGDLLVCDWENTNGGHPSVTNAANFIAEVKRLKPDNKVGLYCSKDDWLNTAVKAGDFLWVAHWTTMAEPGVAAPWIFWQYTDKPIDQNKAASRFI